MPGLEHPKVTQLRYALVLLLCCVASGIASATCNSNIVRTAPDNRYQIQAGGAEVLDTQTNLIWQRCSLGQTFNNLGTAETSDDRCDNSATAYTWQGALQAAQGIATNSGQAWFLPNINELASLVELACSPVINETVFPDTPSSTYWSSSPAASNNIAAWILDFSSGGDDFSSKNDNGRFVRVVRASQ